MYENFECHATLPDLEPLMSVHFIWSFLVGVPAVSFKNLGVSIAPIKYSSISLNFPSQKASLCIS